MKEWIINKGLGLLEKIENRKKINTWEKISSRNNSNISEGFRNYFDDNIFLLNESSKIHISDGVSCRKYCNFLIWDNAELIIHENVFFNNGCSINALEKIEIGENTLFGEGVKLYDHNHTIFKGTKIDISKDTFNTGSIIIGKNCWIASNVVVLKGVTIGDNVVIGAGCVIHKSIPSNSIVKNNQTLSIESF
jgi:acetyltransferase-like isoleucine patch superfamily enzyme